VLAEEGYIDKEADFFGQDVEVVCNNDPGDHVNHVMRADKHHHYPLIAHNEEAHPAQFVPLLRAGL